MSERPAPVSRRTRSGWLASGDRRSPCRRPGCCPARAPTSPPPSTPFGTVTVLTRSIRSSTCRWAQTIAPASRTAAASAAIASRVPNRRTARVAFVGMTGAPGYARSSCAWACGAHLGGRLDVRSGPALARDRDRSFHAPHRIGDSEHRARTGDARGGCATARCRQERRWRSRCRRTRGRPTRTAASRRGRCAARSRNADASCGPIAVGVEPLLDVDRLVRTRRLAARVRAQPARLGATVPVDQVRRDPVEPGPGVRPVELEPGAGRERLDEHGRADVVGHLPTRAGGR